MAMLTIDNPSHAAREIAAWRVAYPDQRLNLYGANLYGANLAGANLAGARLYGANLSGADLSGADLSGANLSGANLSGANLTEAILAGANLYGAILAGANLYGANLAGAILDGAILDGARLPTGETWEQYLGETVPAYLTAGGKTLSEIVASGAWSCHTWTNCPTHVAFGVSRLSAVPILLRPRAAQFIQFYDARLIPEPDCATEIMAELAESGRPS